MGFFTLDLARMVGPNGHVIAVDIQPKMLERLIRRAARAGLKERIETREPKGENLGVDDLAGKVDFVLAFAVVHELPSMVGFFAEVHRALRVGGKMLVAEPKLHVSEAAISETITLAKKVGFKEEATPAIRGSRSVLFSRLDTNNA
jgi:ubiquinone/menaquinone biosynthesis C-methylase UbiE